MEVETRPQPGEGTAAGLVIALALAHFLLQPAREQGAYRGALLGSENASLLEEISFNFQGDIRFCGFHWRHVFSCSTILRAQSGKLKHCWLVGYGWCVIPESVSGLGASSSQSCPN